MILVAGKSGKTQWGKPTGPKSQKYKKAKAQGCKTMKEEDIEEEIMKLKKKIWERTVRFLLTYFLTKK